MTVRFMNTKVKLVQSTCYQFKSENCALIVCAVASRRKTNLLGLFCETCNLFLGAWDVK